MKRTFKVFLAFVMFSGIFILNSCKGKEATTGTLTITAMTNNGAPSIAPGPVPVYLATSKSNLDNHIYVATGYLNSSGSVIFRGLTPNNYWYGVYGWNDSGASDVLAGIDESVYLWLNSPSQK